MFDLVAVIFVSHVRC